ncbi:hypothetical protein BHE74_00057440, partial [Ensete ventricosum]
NFVHRTDLRISQILRGRIVLFLKGCLSSSITLTASLPLPLPLHRRWLPCPSAVALPRGYRPFGRLCSHGRHLHGCRPSADWQRASTAPVGGRRQPLRAVLLCARAALTGYYPCGRPLAGR